MEEQQKLNIVLTGFQRFQLVKLWHKQGKVGDKEEFIKGVCKAKKLIYTPPIKVTRSI